MQSFRDTIRAIGCSLAKRKVHSLSTPFTIGATAVVGISVWLIHLSIWWLVVTIPIFLAVVLGISILLVATLTIRFLQPKLKHQLHSAVEAFVDKAERVSDSFQIPVFIVVYRVIRDIVKPRETSFIAQISNDTTTLHRDFISLQSLFS